MQPCAGSNHPDPEHQVFDAGDRLVREHSLHGLSGSARVNEVAGRVGNWVVLGTGQPPCKPWRQRQTSTDGGSDSTHDADALELGSQAGRDQLPVEQAERGRRWREPSKLYIKHGHAIRGREHDAVVGGAAAQGAGRYVRLQPSEIRHHANPSDSPASSASLKSAESTSSCPASSASSTRGSASSTERRTVR